KCLSGNRTQHRLKTFHSGWHDKQLRDGTVIWTSPSRHTYPTSPAGADWFPLSCTPGAPTRRNRSQRRGARIAQARKLNRECRTANEARRRLAHARKEEIAARAPEPHARHVASLHGNAEHQSLLPLGERNPCA